MLLLAGCAALGGAAAGAQQPGKSAAGSVQAHYRRAEAALREQRLDEAEAEFREMLRLNPRLAEAHANLGTIHFLRAEYPKASAAFREALRFKPGLARAKAFLGMSEARQGRLREALVYLPDGFRHSPNDEWRLRAGLALIDAYHATGEPAKAVEVVRDLEAAFPSNPDVWYTSYRLYSALGARAVSTLARTAPESARLRQLTGELLESEGNFPGAVEQYRAALAIDPKLAGVHRALGVALMNDAASADTLAEAERHFREELALNPSDMHSEYQLGELCWLRNQ